MDIIEQVSSQIAHYDKLTNFYNSVGEFDKALECSDQVLVLQIKLEKLLQNGNKQDK